MKKIYTKKTNILECFQLLIDGEFIYKHTSQKKLKRQLNIWKSNGGKVTLSLCGLNFN